MLKLPKLYAPIKAKFWTLRGAVGESLGWTEVDQEVERTIRRVRCDEGYWRDGWQWQICLRHVKQPEWDWCLEVDTECLNNADLSDITLL
jgi:hypothetical protein